MPKGISQEWDLREKKQGQGQKRHLDSHNTSSLNSAPSVQTSQEQVTYTAVAFYPRKYCGIYLSIEIVIPWCLPTGQYVLSSREKPDPHKR